MQTGYVNKVKSQLAAARKKLDSMTKTLILKHRIDYSMGFTFGFTFGKSGLGFCTPDVNTVQMNMPLLQWNGFIEPGKLRRSILGTKPDEWGAEFFLFFPKIPVNVRLCSVIATRVQQQQQQHTHTHRYISKGQDSLEALDIRFQSPSRFGLKMSIQSDHLQWERQ